MKVQAHAADMGGCGHYRMIWPAQAAHFNELADVDLRTPDDGTPAFPLSVDVMATARAGRTVLAEELAGDIDADVVVIQRPLTPALVTVCRALKRAGIAVVVELVDDFEHIDPRNTAWPTVQPHLAEHNGGRSWRNLAECCDIADLVTVSTPALAARYGAHGRVAIIPNYVPTRYLHTIAPPRPASDQTVRVGWSGSLNTHPGDLETVAGPVASVLARHGLTFHHIGEPDQARMRQALALPASVPYATTGAWLPLGQYPAAMALLDIGIVPLRPGPFNEAKSWLKGLEFAAVGVPFIAAPTGPYRQLADEYGIGLVAATRRDWRALLERLVVDVDYRYELGEQNRARARALTLEPNTDQWANAWHQAAANRKANA